MQKQVETTWASERMANAVLRERINDVASEVVRVAVALEGLNSPIDFAGRRQGRERTSADRRIRLGRRERGDFAAGRDRERRGRRAASSFTASARCDSAPRARPPRLDGTS